jgi:hypothetical protein
MFSRIKNLLVFRLEQLMMRGPVARFGFMLLLVVLVSLMAGAIARQFAPGFESTTDAIWWAFLRLTDPGYLGDDQGLAKGTISTAITILGSILFTGALIAILVQWLDETMKRLEQGLTPVALDAHFVLLGWTSRTPTILQEIMVSQGRVERFLRRRGARQLHVALLNETADATLLQQLRLQLGGHWNNRQIILRSGSPLSEDDLARVDFTHAAAIVVPAVDTTTSSAMDADTRTVKTLMTLGAALELEPPEERPLLVAELQDLRYANTLRTLYGGPMEIIAGDEIIARLMVQNVRHPGLSKVYSEFLSDDRGSQIYVRNEPALVGASAQQLTYAFPEGVLLGVARPRGDGFKALLNPPNDLRLKAGDRIVVLASRYQDAAPPEAVRDVVEMSEKPAPKLEVRTQRRVLVLGWNHRAPLLLSEFASYPDEKFTIDIVSQVSASKREKRLAIEAFSNAQLEVRQLEFDYTVPAYLESVDPTSYDNVVLLASEQLNSGDESDARTILGYLLLNELMEAGTQSPSVLIELTDPDNMKLMENRRAEIIVSPVIVSHMLARVTLRRELRAVFDELFASGGCEVLFHRVAEYGLADILSQIPGHDLSNGEFTFADLQRAADIRGEIAIGIRRAGQQGTPDGGVELNPRRDDPIEINDDDELIVLSTGE